MNECIYGHCLCEDTVLLLMLNAWHESGGSTTVFDESCFPWRSSLYVQFILLSRPWRAWNNVPKCSCVCLLFITCFGFITKIFMAGQKWRGRATSQFLKSLPRGDDARIKNSRMLSLTLRLEKRELLPKKFWAAENSNIDLGQIATPNLWVSYASITLSAKHRKFRGGK